jgi:hypothetical protein
MSYSKNPLIVWQKWIDPFLGSHYEHTHETLDDMLEEPSFINDMEEEKYADQESQEESLENENNKKQAIKAIITPMGVIPLDEYSASSKIFNFWMGHTNFNISKKISNLIDETDGVETLDIFTRYRFRIGIGKLFKPSDVMSNISSNVIEFINKYG